MLAEFLQIHPGRTEAVKQLGSKCCVVSSWWFFGIIASLRLSGPQTSLFPSDCLECGFFDGFYVFSNLFVCFVHCAHGNEFIPNSLDGDKSQEKICAGDLLCFKCVRMLGFEVVPLKAVQ